MSYRKQYNGRTRVKISGGCGVGPPLKTDNPHCKCRIKKAGWVGFRPPWAWSRKCYINYLYYLLDFTAMQTWL